MSFTADAVGGAGGEGALRGSGPGGDETAAILSALLGAEPSAELLAAFKADQQLMGLVKQYATVLHTRAQIDAAKELLQKSPEQEWQGGWGPFGRQRNPAYDADKVARDKAQTLLNNYYQGGNPLGTELSAYKALTTQVTSLQQRVSSRLGQVQTAAGKGAATATNPPDIVWLPTGTPGEERAHVYDETAKKYVPATDAAGNPIPTRRAAN